jgi:hypothetical protein
MNQNFDDTRSGVKIPQEGSLFTTGQVSRRSLQIDAEFKNLIPPLSTDERRQLETNLITEGCRDPLVVWVGHNILLDGHNRWEICSQYGIDFQTVEIELPDWEAARDWIINNQLSRRNLTKEALSYLRGRRYLQQKKPRGGIGANQYRKMQIPQNEGTAQTAERLASELKVSRATIERDAKFALAVDALIETLGDETRRYILSRDAKLTKRDTLELAEVARREPNEAQAIMKSRITGIRQSKVKGKRSLRREEGVSYTSGVGCDYLVHVTPNTWERLTEYMLETEAATLGGAITRLLDEVEQLQEHVAETSRSDNKLIGI